MFRTPPSSPLPPTAPEPLFASSPKKDAALENEEEKIDAALRPLPLDEILVEGYEVVLRRRDMTTLMPEEWLNDNIVNLYFKILQHSDVGAKTYSFLCQFVCVLERDPKEADRWVRDVKLYDFDLLLFPICYGVISHIILSKYGLIQCLTTGIVI